MAYCVPPNPDCGFLDHGCALLGGIQIRNVQPSLRYFPDLSSDHPLNYYIPQYNLAAHWRKPFLIPHSIGFPQVLSRPLEWEYFWANARKIAHGMGKAVKKRGFGSLKSGNVVPYRAPGEWPVDCGQTQLKNRNLLCGMMDYVGERDANVGGTNLDTGRGYQQVVRLWAVSELTDRREIWEYCCRVRKNFDEQDGTGGEDREENLEEGMSEMIIGQSRMGEGHRVRRRSGSGRDADGQEGGEWRSYLFDWKLEGLRFRKNGKSMESAEFDAEEETNPEGEGSTHSRCSSGSLSFPFGRSTRVREFRRNMVREICGAEPVRAIQLPAPALQLISWSDDNDNAIDSRGTANTPRISPRLLVRTEESLCLYDIAGGRLHSLYLQPVDYVSPMPYMSQELLLIDRDAKVWFGDVELMGAASGPKGGAKNGAELSNRLGRMKCAENIKLVCPSDHPRLIYAGNDDCVWLADLRDGRSRGTILYKVPEYDDTKDCGKGYTYENAFPKAILQHITCLSQRRRMLLAVTSNKFCLVDERMPGIRYLEQAHSILEGGDYVISAPRFRYTSESDSSHLCASSASVDGFVYPLYTLRNVGLPDVQQLSFFEHYSGGQRSARDTAADARPRHWSALSQPFRMTEPINIAHFLDEQAKYGIRLGSRERRRWFGDGPTRAIHVQDGLLEAGPSGRWRGRERHLLFRMLSDGSLWYEWVSIQDDRKWEEDAIEKGVRTISQMIGCDWTVKRRESGKEAERERPVNTGPIWERNVSEDHLQQPESLITHWDVLPTLGGVSAAVSGTSKRRRPQSPDIFDEDDEGGQEENEDGVMEVDQATPPENAPGKLFKKSSQSGADSVQSSSRTDLSRTPATLSIPGLVTPGTRAQPGTSRSSTTRFDSTPSSISRRHMGIDVPLSSYLSVIQQEANSTTSKYYPEAEPITALHNMNEQILSSIVLKCWRKYV